nr:nuclear export mediator factor NEMF homolog [Leptinotarsa decemlineata]
MKTRYNTYDIVCITTELQKCVGMRVNNIYDIDNKTYLIRLQRSEEKQVLLLESGNRIHTTNFEWPKNVAPSGFSMKMRKHLKNKRLEAINQIGSDRIVDLQFGSGEATYHVILELYDRGNIVLTDYDYIILNVLRPHTEGDKIKFAVKEKYPQDRGREIGMVSKEEIMTILTNAKVGDQLKKVFVSKLDYGPAVIEHVLLKHNLSNIKIGKNFELSEHIDKLVAAISDAEDLFQASKKQHCQGYIIQKKEERPISDANVENFFYSNQEFHPMLFNQHKSMPNVEFATFNEAVDVFFSSLESQKLELRAVQQERDAMKKLENVRKDHDHRLEALERTQDIDRQKAELITRNQKLVDSAIFSIQTILANQVSWEDIDEMVKDAAAKGDPVAKHIKKLKLEVNHICLYLTDPYEDATESMESDSENTDRIAPLMVDVDLALSAFANARRYYDQKRSAARKQQKTIESQSKALKSAERKTKQTLKEVQTITNINKVRKTYWFEKFFWFISSENYLVIAGRDQQQNELIVKRYMKPTDVYVHADIHGASSVIIKNPSGQPVPPKTLNEAGTMAICYSVAWEAKVITNAYWVWGEQVSKTAPTGEYLTTGSFMIRGKKNFLPPSHLILGLSFLFRLEDGSVERHRGERKVVGGIDEDETHNVAESEMEKDEVEVEVLDESDENELDEKVDTEGNCESMEDIPDNASDNDHENVKFPDTHVKIEHFTETKVNILTKSSMVMQETDSKDNVIYLGDDKPIILKPNLNQRKRADSETKFKSQKNDKTVDFKDAKQHQSKRGQKSKLKKIKEKYGDQDEEERKMRMEILQSSGASKEMKKNKKGKDTQSSKKKNTEPKVPVTFSRKELVEDGGDDDEPLIQADVDMIDALTGTPVSEDELLFAVPIIAPYNTLSNYKFKVKLTPGTAKRGKAARTAVTMFMKDHSITPREKDLLKAVKDEQLARNIPGKVKLSAPRLQNLKKN